jgi:hypothetical protein
MNRAGARAANGDQICPHSNQLGICVIARYAKGAHARSGRERLPTLPLLPPPQMKPLPPLLLLLPLSLLWMSKNKINEAEGLLGCPGGR